MVQLINCNGNHSSNTCDTEDVIPPVVDILLSVACDKEPAEVMMQPGAVQLPFEYRDGRVYVRIDRVNMHNVVVIG